MILQLNPPIPVNCPKGSGLAHLVIDYGVEIDLVWVVFIDSTGECWSFKNPEIKTQKNITFGMKTYDEWYWKYVLTLALLKVVRQRDYTRSQIFPYKT